MYRTELISRLDAVRRDIEAIRAAIEEETVESPAAYFGVGVLAAADTILAKLEKSLRAQEKEATDASNH